MKYTHESEKLNALLGKSVRITMWNGKAVAGKLSRSEYRNGRYEVDNYSFRKTHVKKIEVVR